MYSRLYGILRKFGAREVLRILDTVTNIQLIQNLSFFKQYVKASLTRCFATYFAMSHLFINDSESNS